MKKIIPIILSTLLLAGCAAETKENTYRQVGMEEAMAIIEGIKRDLK